MLKSFLKKRNKPNETISKHIVSLEAKHIIVALGWEPDENNTKSVDLDLSALMLNEEKKLASYEYFIFYSNLTSPDNAISHQGDQKGGLISEDCERIVIKLEQVNTNINFISIAISVHDDFLNVNTIGECKSVFIRIMDFETQKELYRLDNIEVDYPKETTLEIGNFQRIGLKKWIFKKEINVVEAGVKSLVDKYV